jgi:hypothetical protein
MAREENMKKKELKECFERVFMFFDDLNGGNCTPYETGNLGDFPIASFIDASEKVCSLLPKEVTTEVEDRALKVAYDVRDMAFGIGFVIGQQFDLTYPGAKKDIETIKKVIRDEGLLPYLPREKKAA